MERHRQIKLKDSFEGSIEYDSEANDYHHEWVTIDGMDLLAMLEKMGYSSWNYLVKLTSPKEAKPSKIRVTIEVIEVGPDFK